MKTIDLTVICPYKHCKKTNYYAVANLTGQDNFGHSFEQQEIYTTCQHCNHRFQYINPKFYETSKTIFGYT